MSRTVTVDEIKKIQEIQLDMLKEVDRICRMENIQYSIDGGTLLGAIRHKGFIPWDPDIDVIMKRDQYNLFFEAAGRLLDHDKYFLQEERTDPEYRWGHNKLRRNGTVYVRSGQEHLKMHTGIFIDLLVYDNVPDNCLNRLLFEKFCRICRFIMYSEVGKKIEPNLMRRWQYKIANRIPIRSVFKKLEKVRKKNNLKETKLLRYMTCRYTYNKKLHGVNREFFDEYSEYEFEGYKFRGFRDYDKYLTLLYGDYMKLPSEEKRVCHMDVVKMELG